MEKEYRLVVRSSPSELSNSVNELLQEGSGWELYGQPIVTSSYYSQALVKKS